MAVGVVAAALSGGCRVDNPLFGFGAGDAELDGAAARDAAAGPEASPDHRAPATGPEAPTQDAAPPTTTGPTDTQPTAPRVDGAPPAVPPDAPVDAPRRDAAPDVAPVAPDVAPDVAPAPLLEASVATRAGGDVNLTQEGAIDWVYVGAADLSGSRKAGVAKPALSVALVGKPATNTYQERPLTVSWSDGTPIRTNAGTRVAVYASGINCGYRIEVPAPPQRRALRVQLGSWSARGFLRVSLSDAAAVAWTRELTSARQATRDDTLVVQFAGATPTSRLTVEWLMIGDSNAGTGSPAGNVTLQAVTLR